MPIEHYHRKAFCNIIINNVNVTSDLDPYLISVRVILSSKTMNRCDLELDDRDGRLAIPPDKAQIIVQLGWSSVGVTDTTDIGSAGQGQVLPTVPTPPGSENQLPYQGGMIQVFHGHVQEVESGFARSGGGRRLWITGYVADLKGQGKAQNSMVEGEGEQTDTDKGDGGTQIPITDFLSKAGGNAGFGVQVHEGMQNIKRNVWQQYESFFHLMTRMAAENNGRVQYPSPGLALLEPKLAVTGPTVEAVWGANLISWRIKPFSPRAQWSQSSSNYFQIPSGGWADTIKSIAGSTPFGGDAGNFTNMQSVGSESVGESANSGVGGESQSEEGRGWVIINGDPTALPGGVVSLQGARAGVDANWLIEEVEHSFSRRGYTTRMDVNFPSGSGFHNAYTRDFGWDMTERGDQNIPPVQPNPGDSFEERFTGQGPAGGASFDERFTGEQPDEGNVEIGDVEITGGS